MAKVDVLLPFWGDVDLLKLAVGSVLAQTEKDWRLLVFDDCYPSKEPAAYFSSLKDERIIYTRHEKNLGITKNFNFALRAAKANHCVMMGCDDLMLPNYLDTAIKNIGTADFYQPRVNVINEQGVVYLPLGDRIKRLLQPKKSGVCSGEKLATSLCRGNWLYFPSILWKTATIKNYGFDENYTIVMDVKLELQIIKDGGTMYFDTHTTFQYRRFAKSLSSTEKSKGGIRFSEETKIYAYFAKEFKKTGWKKAARAAVVHITSRQHKLFLRS